MNLKKAGMIVAGLGVLLWLAESMEVQGTGNTIGGLLGMGYSADQIKGILQGQDTTSGSAVLPMVATVEGIIPGLSGRKSYSLVAAGALMYWKG